MKYLYYLLFLVAPFAVSAQQTAPVDTTKPVKVAVFVPLYVDDVFDGPVYSLGKSNLPKSVLPGLEFYNGVMLAIDSLKQEGTPLQVNIYDSKATGTSLSQLLKSPELADAGLIIAAITNTTELKIFADNAETQHIPLISATYPNYVGITNNPYFVLLNSSFQAHLEGLFKHMQRYYSSGTIIAVTKKGGTETYIRNYITQLNSSGRSIPLKLKWVTLDENTVNFSSFQASLDSTKKNVVFVASPSETFGLSVVQALSTSDAYPVTAIGMPTWDGIKELDKPECKNVDVVFSTPFLYYSQNPTLSANINRIYKEKYYSRPSDMAFRGYETTYHFIKLLLKHHSELTSNLSDTSFTLFNQYVLVPVKVKSTSTGPDFYENRKLYFVKKQAGTVKSII